MLDKKISLFVFCLFSFLFSAVSEEATNATTEWSWHGVSKKNQDLTLVGFNWFYGEDDNIDGMQLNFLFGLSDKDTKGWQSSNLFNSTAGTMNGFQSSFLFNNSNELNGLSVAFFGLNRTKQNVEGAQIGFVGNICGQDISYGQIGFTNISNGYVGVGQIGGVSINRGFRGIQLNLFSSISLGESTGLQLAAVTWGNGLDGVQIGAVNVNKKLTGLQFGFVNVADEVDGVQLGIINICNNMNGVPIGLIDIQKNGENHFYYTAETTFNRPLEQLYHTIGYRFGGRYFYKSLNFGFRTGRDNEQIPLYSAGFQIGGRISVINNMFAIMTDVGLNICNWQQTIVISYKDTIQDHLLPESREMFEWKLNQQFGLLCGFKQRFYCDVWNNQHIPDNVFEFIKTPGGSLFVQNSLFLGVEY